MRYSCALFDLDNTLLVRAPSVAEKIYERLSGRMPALALETVERLYAESELWIGNQVRKENETGVRMDDDEFARNLLSVYRKELPFDDSTALELLPILSGRYEKSYALMPGAHDALGFLQKSNVKMGIVSNNHSSVRHTLDELELTKYFQCVIISDEVGISKPDPRILKLACESIGVDCAEALYIGDHPFDILCAHSANMAVSWFPPNQYYKIPNDIDSPEYTIHRLTELKKIWDA